MPGSPSDPNVPIEREGQYTRLDELGRGAQSIVWRARDEFMTREVALKELSPDPAVEEGTLGLSSAEASRRRFLREARLVAGLDHPGIVSVLELARRPDGTVFCAQKLVRGETLKARLARCGSLAERLELLPHLTAACQAVAYAHARGVIHRDLKPSNVMVGTFGETVVVDWGLAKRRGEPEPELAPTSDSPDPGLTRTGHALGTPRYMSPEQARGDWNAVDVGSDVFSLGVVLYELLTGRAPFDGATAEHVLERLLEGRYHPVRVVAPSAPPELAAIAERALAARPEDRFPDAESLARELSTYASGGRVRSYHYRPRELLRKFVAANPALSVVTVVAVALLVAAAAVVLHQLRVTRLDLARSFVERARAAEAASDWARAAGYYAASRVEHDSAEAQWGFAMATEHVSPRVVARRGAPDSAVGVGRLDDGRVLVVGRDDESLVATLAESGRELWRVPLPAGFRVLWMQPGHQILLARLGGGGPLDEALRVIDATDGHPVASFVARTGMPCARSPTPPPVLATPSGLVIASDGSPEPLWTRPVRDTQCAVSTDGRQLAFTDEGKVHLWSVPERRELGVRIAPDLRTVLFTAHGVAMVRASSIDVFGGAEGDFSVDIPRGSGTVVRPRPDSVVTSGDGHRLLVARDGSDHADVVDLRTRTVVTSFGHPPGRAGFVFSSDGERVWAAGLGGDASVLAWDVRAPVPRRVIESPTGMGVFPSRDGRRILSFHYALAASRWQLFDDEGTPLRSGTLGYRANVSISPDGGRIVTRDGDGVAVLEADTGRAVWTLPCSDCMRIEPSADGSRLLTAGENRVALWAVGATEPVWSIETRPRLGSAIRLSPDGSRAVWTESGGRTVRVHALDGSPDFDATFDEGVTDAVFSLDGARLVVASHGEVTAWDVRRGTRLWRASSPASVYATLELSMDDSVVLAAYASVGTVLLDARTGRRLAVLPLSKPRSERADETVLPSLRTKLSMGGGRWELWTLPQPERGPPQAALARTLASTGLALVDAELVDVGPTPPRAEPRSAGH